MTYQEWEVIQRIKNRAVWRHNKSHAMITLKAEKEKGRTIYIVSVSGGLGPIAIRSFKIAVTKPEAESYVRNYMRHFGA